MYGFLVHRGQQAAVYTKLAHANQTAKKVARKLWDHVFCVYGFPARIHSDQGTKSRATWPGWSCKIPHDSLPPNRQWGERVPSNSTAPWVTCCLPFPLKKNSNGHNKSRPSRSLTMPPSTKLWAMHPSSSCLGVSLDCRWTMFKQVLDDPRVADYESYAKSLLSG